MMELFRATNSVADACLGVTDATCVVAATMRSIICKHVVETKGRAKNLQIDSNDNSKFENEDNQIAKLSPIALLRYLRTKWPDQNLDGCRNTMESLMIPDSLK